MGSRQAPESQEEPPPSPKCLKGSLMEGLSDPAHLIQAWRDWGGQARPLDQSPPWDIISRWSSKHFFTKH